MADFVTAVSGNAHPPQLQPISFVFNAGALGLGLLKTPDRVRLDVITVDATMQETHTFEADITEHPVEQGANITDHIRPKLKHYSIDGIISNTPIGPTGDLSDALHTGALALGVTLPTFPTSYDADLARSAGSTTRAKAVFEKLIALMDAAETITIHTPLKDYASMALESISVVRDQHLSSGAIRFMAVCKEVRTVAALKTVTSALPDSAQPSKDLGTQNPTGASDKIKGRAVSGIKSFTNSIGWTDARKD
jgi:hypothetical protein